MTDLAGPHVVDDGPDLLEDRELPKYDYITFMQNMMDPGELDEEGHVSSVNGH